MTCWVSGGRSSRRKGRRRSDQTTERMRLPDTKVKNPKAAPTGPAVSRAPAAFQALPTTDAPVADSPRRTALLTVFELDRLCVGKRPGANRLQVSQQTDLTTHGGHCRA